MEFRYFFSIVVIVALSIGVFGGMNVSVDDNRVAAAHTTSAFHSLTGTPNPHN